MCNQSFVIVFQSLNCVTDSNLQESYFTIRIEGEIYGSSTQVFFPHLWSINDLLIDMPGCLKTKYREQRTTLSWHPFFIVLETFVSFPLGLQSAVDCMRAKTITLIEACYFYPSTWFKISLKEPQQLFYFYTKCLYYIYFLQKHKPREKELS